MAQKLLMTLVDDLDGTDAVESVDFALDGVKYQIDLSAENAGELRDVLSVYVEQGRRVKGRKRRAAPKAMARARPAAPTPPRADREQNQAMRTWARKNGFKVSDRGRIPGEVVTAYHTKK